MIAAMKNQTIYHHHHHIAETNYHKVVCWQGFAHGSDMEEGMVQGKEDMEEEGSHGGGHGGGMEGHGSQGGGHGEGMDHKVEDMERGMDTWLEHRRWAHGSHAGLQIMVCSHRQ